MKQQVKPSAQMPNQPLPFFKVNSGQKTNQTALRKSGGPRPGTKEEADYFNR